MKTKARVLQTGLFAIQAHRAQRRKSGQPFVSHPIGVAKILKGVLTQFDPELLASKKGKAIIKAALLHDTLEDTKLAYGEIKKKTGKATANLVRELTSEEKEIDKLRQKYESERVRKAVYLARRMNQMSSKALLVKLADRLHNLQTPVSPEWLDQYAKETMIILQRIKRRIGNESRMHQALFAKIKAMVEKEKNA